MSEKGEPQQEGASGARAATVAAASMLAATAQGALPPNIPPIQVKSSHENIWQGHSSQIHSNTDLMREMIAASEGRNEIKLISSVSDFKLSLAQIGSDVKTLNALICSKASTSTVITTGVTVALAIIGTLIAILAYGSQSFGLGLDTSSKVDSAAQRALDTYRESVGFRNSGNTPALTKPSDRSSADVDSNLDAQ